MLCLQGGAEFGAGCRSMDADLLRHADGGPVVIAPLAGAQGSEYAVAGQNGVRHFLGIGAARVSVAPDVREDPSGALAALREARLLVLPGGSPSRLLSVLQSTGVGALVADLLDDGGLVMGASAGAMVLCAWTVLPDRRGPAGPAVVPGLGIVPGLLVVPHWSGGSTRRDWLRAIDDAVPEGVHVVGLAEQSGVLVQDRALTAVGTSPAALVSEGRALPLDTTWRPT